MGKFGWGFFAGILAMPVLGAIYLMTGAAPAAVADRPLPFEKIFAGGSLHARISREAPKRDLSSFTQEDLIAGAKAYRQGGCADCHSVPPPTERRPHVMYPPAPELFTPDGMVTDDPVGVSYWKVKNGIRLTGMPSYKDALTDEQIWQVAALVTSADKLTPEVIETLKTRPGPPPEAAGTPGTTATPLPTSARARGAG
jgi:thiosulfate dehydrogenase